jgi:hypothetical protein
MQYSHQLNAAEFPTIFSQLLSTNCGGVKCPICLTHFYSRCFQFVFIAVIVTFIVKFKDKYRFRSAAMLLFYIVQKLVITVLYIYIFEIHLPQRISGYCAYDAIDASSSIPPCWYYRLKIKLHKTGVSASGIMVISFHENLSIDS